MYTTEILKKEVNTETQQLVVVVRFVDGVNNFDKKYNFDPMASSEDVLRRIKIEVNRLSQAGVLGELVPTGALDLSAVTLSATIPAGQVAREEWLANFHRLEKADALIKLGVFSNTEPAYLTLLAKVQTDWKPAYINFI